MAVDVAQPTLTPLGANDRTRETSPDDSADPIPFLCECDGGECGQSVWLTAAEYDEARAMHATAIVVPAHVPLGHTGATYAERYAVIDLAILYD